jgi:hypothetical protein
MILDTLFSVDLERKGIISFQDTNLNQRKQNELLRIIYIHIFQQQNTID